VLTEAFGAAQAPAHKAPPAVERGVFGVYTVGVALLGKAGLLMCQQRHLLLLLYMSHDVGFSGGPFVCCVQCYNSMAVQQCGSWRCLLSDSCIAWLCHMSLDGYAFVHHRLCGALRACVASKYGICSVALSVTCQLAWKCNNAGSTFLSLNWSSYE
jgi:hypothetical protein